MDTHESPEAYFERVIAKLAEKTSKPTPKRPPTRQQVARARRHFLVGAVEELLRRSPGIWIGSSTDLLTFLDKIVSQLDRPLRRWAKTPSGLSLLLREVYPLLVGRGIGCYFYYDKDPKTRRPLYKSLLLKTPTMPPPDLPSLAKASVQADHPFDRESALLILAHQLSLHLLAQLIDFVTSATKAGWNSDELRSYLARVLRAVASHLES